MLVFQVWRLDHDVEFNLSTMLFKQGHSSYRASERSLEARL